MSTVTDAQIEHPVFAIICTADNSRSCFVQGVANQHRVWIVISGLLVVLGTETPLLYLADLTASGNQKMLLKK